MGSQISLGISVRSVHRAFGSIAVGLNRDIDYANGSFDLIVYIIFRRTSRRRVCCNAGPSQVSGT